MWSVLLSATMVLGIAPAAAQQVYVLTAGGQPQLEVIAVEASEDSAHLGTAQSLPLRLEDGSVASYTDLVVLPGGHLLLADGSGRGAVRFDEQGDQVDQLFAPGSFAAPPSVVVAGFVFPNVPDLLLMPHNSTGHLRIYDQVADHFVWNYSKTLDSLRPTVARAVVMPQGRVAAAFRWPTLDLSVLSIISVEPSEEPEITVATSREHAEFEGAAVIPDLHPVRDLMGSADGPILVTSQTALHVLESSGQIAWSFELGDDPGLGGEFQSARWLDSGLIVAATREPGRWNEPHTNHRVHLLDPAADPVRLASSASFDAAPLRLEAVNGHGGTGSLDFFADAEEGGQASPETLTVDFGPVITPESLFPSEQTELHFGGFNDGDQAISIRRAELRAAPAPCAEATIPRDNHHRWWSDLTANRIEPGEDWVIDGHPLDGGELHPGQWCAYLTMMGRDGAVSVIGEPQDVEIRAPAGRDGPVRVEDLAEFDGSDAGIGDDAGISDNGPGRSDPSGCSCATRAGTPPALPALILILLAGLSVGRTRLQNARR